MPSCPRCGLQSRRKSGGGSAAFTTLGAFRSSSTSMSWDRSTPLSDMRSSSTATGASGGEPAGSPAGARGRPSRREERQRSSIACCTRRGRCKGNGVCDHLSLLQITFSLFQTASSPTPNTSFSSLACFLTCALAAPALASLIHSLSRVLAIEPSKIWSG